MNTTLKRILILASEFPPEPGGIGNQAYNIGKYLKESGYEINVYTSSRNISNEIEFDIANADFNITRYKSNSLLKNIYKTLKFILKNRNTIDVVFLSGSSPILLTKFIKLFCGWKVITIIHGHEVLTSVKILKLLVRYSIKKADRIIAVSDFSKQNVLTNVPIDPKKIVTISNGISLDKFNNKNGISNKSLSVDQLKLITVGSVTKRKGQMNVVRALPLLKKHFKNVEYHMIGISQEKQLIDKAASDLKVSDNIFMHGKLSDNELYNVLNKCDIFVMLSDNLPTGEVEGFGIAIIEGNLLGLPAIGSKGCGIEGAITNKYSGILVDQKNSAEILNAVNEIINNYQAYSTNAIAWAHHHDWNRLIKDYIKVINS